MTEEEAKIWLRDKLHVSRETLEQLEEFRQFLFAEAKLQNLVSAASMEHYWARHVVDSAQLLLLAQADTPPVKWLDLGSGAGFPGLVVAMIAPHQVTLVESRGRRIDFLQRAADKLGLKRVTVAGMRLEQFETLNYDIISARAFAPLPRLLTLAQRFSTEITLWLLPKGRNAVKELSEAQKQREWRGRLDFRSLPSQTDAEAGVLVGRLLPAGQPRSKRNWKRA